MEKMTTRSWKMFSLLALLLMIGGIGNAWAGHHHGHVSTHVGVYFGPAWDPWYYRPPPVYYYPPAPIVIERAPPPVYIEQAEPAPAPNAYWYYCNASRAYYPYVKECPSGWQRVSPRPPQQ